MKFEMTENGFETETAYGKLHISPKDEYGFRPYQLLVSSVAVCSGGVMRKILDKMRMPAEHITVEAKEVVRNPDEADRLEKIHLHFTIKGSSVDEAKMERVLELTAKNCSMARSVEQSIKIVETYDLL